MRQKDTKKNPWNASRGGLSTSARAGDQLVQNQRVGTGISILRGVLPLSCVYLDHSYLMSSALIYMVDVRIEMHSSLAQSYLLSPAALPRSSPLPEHLLRPPSGSFGDLDVVEGKSFWGNIPRIESRKEVRQGGIG